MPDLFRRSQRDANRLKIRGQLLLFLLESKHVFLQYCPKSNVQSPTSVKSQRLWTLDFGHSLLCHAGNQSFANSFFFPGAVARDLLIDQLHIETERLKFAYQHVER